MRSLVKNIVFKASTLTTLSMITVQQCYASGGTDILAEPAANIFATFKGTGVSLLILAQIIGCYNIYHKTGDMKAWIALPVLLTVTGWAATKF